MNNDQPGRRVLVVDDERIIALTVSQILRNAGFDADFALSAAEALQKLPEYRPDILLSDIAMPGMDGIDLSVQVAEMLPGCRIILFSGYAAKANLQKLKDSGISYRLASKPLPPPQLIQLLQSGEPEVFDVIPTVLLVDDYEMHRYSMSRLLAYNGFKVIEAASGTECLDRVNDHPDAIVLDVNMPDLNGFEVCSFLKSQPATAKIPIVHLTSTHKNEESKAQSIQSGADEYLTHPINPETLGARLRSIIQANYLRT